jgi:F-type H+-transporting ATPase subunit epsilon
MDNKSENIIIEERKFRLRVLTPLSVAYDKHIEMVIAKTSEGDWGVMYNHDMRSALLGDGVLRIFEDAKRDEELLVVLGGVFTVNNNDVDVISEIAGHPDEIQQELDKLESAIAEREMADQATELYMKRMELAMMRALVHTDGGAYPVMDKSGKQTE